MVGSVRRGLVLGGLVFTLLPVALSAAAECQPPPVDECDPYYGDPGVEYGFCVSSAYLYAAGQCRAACRERFSPEVCEPHKYVDCERVNTDRYGFSAEDKCRSLGGVL